MARVSFLLLLALALPWRASSAPIHSHFEIGFLPAPDIGADPDLAPFADAVRFEGTFAISESSAAQDLDPDPDRASYAIDLVPPTLRFFDAGGDALGSLVLPGSAFLRVEDFPGADSVGFDTSALPALDVLVVASSLGFTSTAIPVGTFFPPPGAVSLRGTVAEANSITSARWTIPEPSIAVLVGLGLAGARARRRGRRTAA